MRRLKGRLDLYSPSALGRSPIDPELLLQVALQAEARLTLVLQKQYQLPLRQSHPTLAEYVECRSVCAIIPIHFQRQNVSDDRGLGEVACREADKLLAAIQSGEIQLRGEVSATTNLLRAEPSTLVVPRRPGAAEAIQF